MSCTASRAPPRHGIHHVTAPQHHGLHCISGSTASRVHRITGSLLLKFTVQPVNVCHLMSTFLCLFGVTPHVYFFSKPSHISVPPLIPSSLHPLISLPHLIPSSLHPPSHPITHQPTEHHQVFNWTCAADASCQHKFRYCSDDLYCAVVDPIAVKSTAVASESTAPVTVSPLPQQPPGRRGNWRARRVTLPPAAVYPCVAKHPGTVATASLTLRLTVRGVPSAAESVSLGRPPRWTSTHSLVEALCTRECPTATRPQRPFRRRRQQPGDEPAATAQISLSYWWQIFLS